MAQRLEDPEAARIQSTIGEVLRARSDQYPDRPAIVWRTNIGISTLSYQQLLDEAKNCARWISQFAAPGQVVGIWSKNCIEWIIAEYGCALSGAILASFNSAWTDHELQHAVDLTRPTIIFAGSDARGASLLDRARSKACSAIVAPIEELRTYSSPDSELPHLGPEAPFLIQFTSGTTGRAKGALLSHSAALNGGMLRALHQQANPSDVFLNGSPLHHIAGSVSLILGTLIAGATYVLVDKPSAAEMISLMLDTKATRLGGVPTILKDMLEHPTFPRGQVRLAGLGIGGTDVPESLVHQLSAEFQAPVSVGYGQSESPLIANSDRNDPPHIIAATVGRIPPQNAVKIVNPSTRGTLAVGEIGEIYVRSPCTMIGYYRMEEATAEVLDVDGWLNTGDLGSLDAEGYLRVQGRSREVIIRGGVNIYPPEIEQILSQHPDVQDVAAFGVGDERLGQAVAVAVVLKPGASCETNDLRDYVGARLTHYKVPRHWFYVDALPMTASGKVRRTELATRFADPTAAAIDSDST